MKIFTKILLAILVFSFFCPTAFGQQKLYNSLNKRMAILYKNGKITEAIETAQEVVNVAEKTFGKNHAYYCASVENLALLYVNDSNYEKAAELYEESFTVRENILGKNHPRLKDVLEKLLKCYESMMADEKVLTVKERLLTIQN